MADTVIPVNPATNPPIINMDAEGVTYGPGDERVVERVQVFGDQPGQKAAVANADPPVDTYGLVTRNLPERTAAAPTITQVLANAASVQLLAANPVRKQACIANDASSKSVVLIKLGAGAAANSYTIALPPGGYYELPQPVYTGEIDGIWLDGSAGFVMATEIT